MLRKAVVALGPLLLGVTALFACEDDSANGITTDAGGLDVNLTTPPTVDGAIVTTDGDSATSPPPVGVTVTSVFGPVAGIPVVFHDATGAVLETLATGADGKIASTQPGVGQVTAFFSRGARRHAVTWTNVSAGDQLQAQDLPSSVGTYDVAFTTVAGGTAYTAYSGACAAQATATAGPPTVALALTSSCVGTVPTPVLLGTSVRASPRFAFTTTNPTAPVDGGAANVTIPNNWATSSTTVLSLANGNGNTLDVDVVPLASGLLFSSAASSSTLTTGSVNLTYPTNFGDALQANVRENTGEIVRFLAKRYPLSGAIDFDYVTMLGPVGAPSIDETTPTRPVISWTGDTSQTDGGLVNVLFSSGRIGYSWTFVVPPGTTKVTTPSLPIDYAAFSPDADAGAGARSATLEFIEADMFDSSSFRQTGAAILSPWLSPYAAVLAPSLPATGTFRATARILQSF